MPDGSSSAAPVMTPGPSDFNSKRVHRAGKHGHERVAARITYESCYESTHNPTWRSVQIECSEWSNVIRCPSSPVLPCAVVKKWDDRYNGQSSFLLQVRYKNGNGINCSRGAVFARWRRVGILSLARLAQLPDGRVTILLDPNLRQLGFCMMIGYDTL
jgi:hypothetical protein